jgi:tRNA (guanine-N7-)-methyltransferase
MEIIFKRLYKTAQKSEKRKASNFCLIRDKGENIDRIFDTGEIDVSYILFPDPWGKKRYQRKNRLLQKPFLEQLFTITKTGGDFFFRTDHREYFEEVLGIMRTLPWQEHRISFDYAQEPDIYDPTAHTEFEDIWRAEKLPVCYGHWKKSSK